MEKLYNLKYDDVANAERMRDKIVFWIEDTQYSVIVEGKDVGLTPEELKIKIDGLNCRLSEIDNALDQMQGSYGRFAAPWNAHKIIKKYAKEREALDVLI